MNTRINLEKILNSEQTILVTRVHKLNQAGISELFEHMLDFMQTFIDEVEHCRDSSRFGEAKRVNQGVVLSWDARLAMHMFGNSLNQFIFATSHIFRGQATEIYGHVRRAIENVGIAHLAKTEPDIAEFYKTGNEYEMSKRFPTSKLFPLSDPNTRDLNRMIKKASSYLHGNINSNSLSLVEEMFTEKNGRALFEFTFSVTDDMSLDSIWGASRFVLLASYHVARLYAKTFELPEGNFYMQLESFKVELDKRDVEIQMEINSIPPS